MSDTTDMTNRLRHIVRAQTTPGPWRQDDRRHKEHFVWAEVSGVMVDVAECLWAPEDAEHIATFDPVLVDAMLDVIEAAETKHYAIPNEGWVPGICASCVDVNGLSVVWPCEEGSALARLLEVAG